MLIGQIRFRPMLGGTPWFPAAYSFSFRKRKVKVR